MLIKIAQIFCRRIAVANEITIVISTMRTVQAFRIRFSLRLN